MKIESKYYSYQAQLESKTTFKMSLYLYIYMMPWINLTVLRCCSSKCYVRANYQLDVLK